MILNSPRRGATSTSTWSTTPQPDCSLGPSAGRHRAGRPGRARRRRRRHLRHAGHGDRCATGRDRAAPPQPGRQAGHRQRRAADAARARRAGAGGQARPVRHPDRAGRRHAGRVRRPAAAQRRRRPPAVGAARHRRGAHRPGSGRPRRDLRRRDPPRAPARRSPAAFPARTHTTSPGSGRWSPRARAETAVPGASFGGMLDVLGGRHRLLALRGRLPRRGATRPAARSATCSAAPSASACPSAATCSTSGPLTPATTRTAGARRSTPTSSSPRPTDGRRLGLRLAQAQGRGAPARRRVRGDRGAARGVPRPAAAPGPQRRVDAETSVGVAERLAGVVEYLEDPTPGIEGMA